MKKYFFHVVPILLAVAVPQFAFGDPPRALLVTGHGTYEGMGAETPYEVTAAAMEAKGWTVGSMDFPEVLATDAADLAANWNVIWVVPGTDVEMHCWLSEAGTSVEAFVQNGGVVVMPGVSTAKPTTDVAPGGLDVFSEATPGSTVITDPTHPLIAAADSGGVDLTPTDLDPEGTGGAGCCGPAPPGITCICIAHNDVETVLIEYSLGTGHVLVSVLDLLGSNSLNNLLLYVNSIVQGS